MIERHIKSILEKDGRVAIPSLGTFTTSVYSARIDESENIIAPPGSKISFVESIDYSEKGILVQSIIDELENGDKIQVEFDVKKYADSLRTELKENGKATIEKLGYFGQDDYGDIIFQQEEGINFLDSSFGLPTIDTSDIPPVTPGEEEVVEKVESGGKKEVKDKKSDLVLVLILIPLILVSAFLFYLFMNDDARKFFNESINPFQSNDTELLESENDNLISQNDTLGLVKNNDTTGPIENKDTNGKGNKKDNTKASNKKSDDKKPSGKKQSDKKNEVKKSNNNSSSSNQLVISSKTNRYYLVYASFSSLANAKKSVNKERGRGNKQAKVIHIKNKFRTSIADFNTSKKAEAEIRKYKNRYKGVWVFKY